MHTLRLKVNVMAEKIEDLKEKYKGEAKMHAFRKCQKILIVGCGYIYNGRGYLLA